MKISEIAERCGYEFCGENIDVNNIRYAGCADENSIAILKSIDDMNRLKAKCILSTPRLIKTDKSIIYTGDSIEFASVMIARILNEDNNKQYSKLVKYTRKDGYYLGENVVIGNNTYICPNVCIDNNVIIGSNCYISANAHIKSNVIIKNGVSIGDGTIIGAESFYHYFDNGLQEFEGLGTVIINDNVSIGSNTIIQRGTFSDTLIGARSRIGNLIDIGHDVFIGHDCKIVSQTGIASNVRIKNYVTIYGQVGVANGINIGNQAVVYAKSLVTKNIDDNQHVSGMYARDHIDELRIQAKLRKL